MANAYVCFCGSILLRLNGFVTRELNELWEMRKSSYTNEELYYDRIKFYQGKVKSVLDKPNISNVRFMEELRPEHFDPVDIYEDEEYEYLMQFSSPIMFDVCIPKEQRKYLFNVKYNDNLIEKFSVIYDGVVFFAYAPVYEDINETQFLGPEIREFLIKTLDCEFWKPVAIPPCPIRHKFYVESITNKKNNVLMLSKADENVENIAYRSDGEILDIMEFLYNKYSFFIEEFISLMSLKSYIERITWKIEEDYCGITDKFKKYYFKFLKLGLEKNIRKNIFTLYKLLHDYDFHIYKYNFKRNLIMDEIKTYGSNHLAKYVESEINIDSFPQNNIMNTINHIEQSITSFKSNYYGIVGAIIGALAATITTILVG